MTIAHHPEQQRFSISSWANAELLASTEMRRSNPDTSPQDSTILFLDHELRNETDEEKDLEHAMSNIRNFFGLFDGREYEADKFESAFADAFDAQVTGLTHRVPSETSEMQDPTNRTEMDYQGLLETCRNYALTRNVATLDYVRPLFKGVVEYSMKCEHDGSLVLFKSHAYTRQGKIVRVERHATVVESSTSN